MHCECCGSEDIDVSPHTGYDWYCVDCGTFMTDDEIEYDDSDARRAGHARLRKGV